MRYLVGMGWIRHGVVGEGNETRTTSCLRYGHYSACPAADREDGSFSL